MQGFEYWILGKIMLHVLLGFGHSVPNNLESIGIEKQPLQAMRVRD
jgi:hypothetical protein